jgi:LemA protein
MKKMFLVIAVFLLVAAFIGVSINQIPSKQEAVHSTQSMLMSQYKRRTDLIPQLVNTVKGASDFEKSLLENVVKARQHVMQIDATDGNMNKFIQAQDQLGSALSRLLVTVESYPQVKAVEAFTTLQAQLEGTENRIVVARRDYIQSIQTFNTEIRTLPGVFWNKLIFHYDSMSQLSQDSSVETPVEVNFK